MTCWRPVRILLDESLPRPLSRLLVGHDVSTVAREGWTSLTNGALLLQAAERFDVVLTADQNIQFQQNLSTCPSPSSFWSPKATAWSHLSRWCRTYEALKNLKTKTLVRVSA